jgi:hypothetical protein
VRSGIAGVIHAVTSAGSVTLLITFAPCQSPAQYPQDAERVGAVLVPAFRLLAGISR